MRFSTLAEWLSWQQTLHPSAIDMGLARVQRTLQRLGWRRPAYPVITVGGTNGKGSSVALLARILTEAGYRVGAFTSPHLLRYNERVTIAESEVSDASLMAAFERIDSARADETLTFFEFNALAALLVFETAGLDAMILEVGMGGRLDAVNVVDADAALLTSVALDHCEWLGRDVETIGREKAGIFRAGRTAVYGSISMPKSVQQTADAIGTKLLRLGRDFSHRRETGGWSWFGASTQLANLPPPALIGDVQYDNAAAVLTVLEALGRQIPVDAAAIGRGLRTVHVPGRFQVFRGAAQWVLDVAHNPAAARTLVSQLESLPVPGRSLAVCGILGDKDVEGIADELHGSFDEWIVAGLDSERAVAPETLAQRLRSRGAHVVAVAPDVLSACELARERAAPDDRIVVFGSFLTVAPAVAWLREHVQTG